MKSFNGTCFSNFYKSDIFYKNMWFDSSEAAF